MQVRYTLFPKAPFPDLGLLFEEYFGVEADSETHVRSEARSTWTGKKDGVVSSISVLGPRVDFAIEAENEPEHDGFGILPDQAVHARFVGSAINVVQKFEHVWRIAVGEKYLLKAESKVEGYTLMGAFLHKVDVDPESSFDFLYRINRPRQTQIGDTACRINRLSHWGCMVMRRAVGILGQGVPDIQDLQIGVSLDTDVNSAPERSLENLNGEQLAEVTQKLFSFSAEMAEKGDVA